MGALSLASTSAQADAVSELRLLKTSGKIVTSRKFPVVPRWVSLGFGFHLHPVHVSPSLPLAFLLVYL